MKIFVAILRTIGPFLLGSVGIFAWNIAVSQLAFATGVGPEPGPDADFASFTTGQWIVRLVQTTFAGVVGALLCTRVAHRRPEIHMIVFSVIWFTLDALGLVIGPAGVPLWVHVVALVLVPPQLYAGYRLGLLWRGGESRASDSS